MSGTAFDREQVRKWIAGGGSSWAVPTQSITAVLQDAQEAHRLRRALEDCRREAMKAIANSNYSAQAIGGIVDEALLPEGGPAEERE